MTGIEPERNNALNTGLGHKVCNYVLYSNKQTFKAKQSDKSNLIDSVTWI